MYWVFLLDGISCSYREDRCRVGNIIHIHTYTTYAGVEVFQALSRRVGAAQKGTSKVSDNLPLDRCTCEAPAAYLKQRARFEVGGSRTVGR